MLPVYLWIRARKTDKDYKLPVVSAVTCAACIIMVIVGRYTEIGNKYLPLLRSKSQFGHLQEVEIVDMDFLCPQYAILEKEDIPFIVPTNYVPDSGIYLYETSWFSDKSTTKLTVQTDSLSGTTFTEETGETIRYGDYYIIDINTSDSALLVKQYSQNDSSQESLEVEMIPQNRTYDRADDSTILGIPYSYTVTVRAGTFENCVCMATIKTTDTGAENCTIAYYAPSVGKVLELHNEELYRYYNIGWFVFSELISVQKDGTVLENIAANE